MAGSYEHLKSLGPELDGGGWSLIENMGDAHECVEELFYLVRCFGDNRDIQEALEVFYKYERGELDPLSEPSLDFSVAYLEAKDVMSK